MSCNHSAAMLASGCAGCEADLADRAEKAEARVAELEDEIASFKSDSLAFSGGTWNDDRTVWRSHAADSVGEGPAITFTTQRTKPLADLTAADVPRGVDPEDVATDFAPRTSEASPPPGTPPPKADQTPDWLKGRLFGARAALSRARTCPGGIDSVLKDLARLVDECEQPYPCPTEAEREIDRLVASKTPEGRPMHPCTDYPRAACDDCSAAKEMLCKGCVGFDAHNSGGWEERTATLRWLRRNPTATTAQIIEAIESNTNLDEKHLPCTETAPTKAQRAIELMTRDFQCACCGKLMTDHVYVTRCECGETYTGPPIRSLSMTTTRHR